MGPRLLAAFVAVFLVFPAAYYFLFWMVFATLGEGGAGMASGLSLLAAGLVSAFAWWRLRQGRPGLLSAMAVGGVVVGAVGFVLGFFGPILLAPDSPQGPLLGLFITGPAGFLLGLVAGALYWRGNLGQKKGPEGSGTFKAGL